MGFGKLYGSNMLAYNVHSLIHLADDAQIYGSLDNVSAFPFENYMQTLKKLLRKLHLPLQQAIHRIYETATLLIKTCIKLQLQTILKKSTMKE